MTETLFDMPEVAKLPADEPARRIIRGADGLKVPVLEDPDLILDRNLVVRAGAGSGKTRSLVDRMVALVRSGVPIRQVAAITFTIKAAGELRVRFSKALRKAAGQADQLAESGHEAEREAWQNEAVLLRQGEKGLEHVFIGTVHAFCGRLLHERPFEAGLAPDFGHIDPGLVMAHRRKFWGGFVARSADRWLSRMEAVDLDPADLFELFSTCVNNEDVPLEGLAMQPPCPDLTGPCDEVVALVDEITARTALTPGEDSLLRRVRALDRYLSRNATATPAQQAAVLQRASKLGSASVVLKNWGEAKSENYGYARSMKTRMPEFVEQVVEPALSAWRDHVFFDAGRFVEEAVIEYSQLRRRTGDQTFDDLLWGAKRMLEKSPDNRAHFARRFSHILVDEFQDTDPVQAEVLLYLSSENRDESNPWRCRPRPGSLFIVGDDKQSIYRFRRADVDVFRRFEEVLLKAGGSRVNLTANFRSDPRICGFVNRALAPVFREAEEGSGQAEWEDLVAFSNEAPGRGPVVARLPIPSSVHKKRGNMVNAEAPRVALVIERLVRGGELPTSGETIEMGRPLRFSDVMVLFRTASYMPDYVAELNRLKIPYSISGGKTLGKSQSLKLLLDPLDAVLKQDSVALLAFLRGPFSGVSDADLMDYVEAGGSLRMPIPADGTVVPGEALAAGLAMIRDLARRLWNSAPADAIQGWVMEHGLLASLAVGPEGGGDAGSLIRILAMVRGWDTHGMSWPEVVEELHRLQDEDIEAEQLTLDALEGDAVQLMTTHQAKGLEARVVILADPHWPSPPGNDLFVDRSGKDATLAVKVENRGRETLAWTPGWVKREAQDGLLQQAEEERLAYVAGTRAEELLLVGYHPRAEGPWTPFYAAVAEVPEVAESVFEEAAADDGVAPDAHAPDPGDLAAVEAELAQLAERRELVAQPTYREVRASEDGDSELFYQMTGEGRGKDFGTLVHRLLEQVILNRGGDLAGSWLERIAARHAADIIGTEEQAVRVREAVAMAQAFMRSPLWREVVAADRVLAEVPYTFWTDGEAESESADAAIHTGIIDLVLIRDGAWTVVDYKTDPHTLEDLSEKHGGQLREYAEALRLLSGAPEVRLLIWSTHNGDWVEVQGFEVGAD